MGEFFKFIANFTKQGRRRLGIRLLVLASMLTVGWIRSLICFDEFDFHTGHDRIDALLSTDSSIGWESQTGFASRRAGSLSFVELFPGNPFVDISASRDPRVSRWNWRWYWCGFAVGSQVYGDGYSTQYEYRNVWLVPYWIIVGPLVMCSAWLFLGDRTAEESRRAVEQVRSREDEKGRLLS